MEAPARSGLLERWQRARFERSPSSSRSPSASLNEQQEGISSGGSAGAAGAAERQAGGGSHSGSGGGRQRYFGLLRRWPGGGDCANGSSPADANGSSPAGAEPHSHGMALNLAGGDHSTDGHPHTPNSAAGGGGTQLTSLAVQQQRSPQRGRKRGAPGSLVVQPAVRIAALPPPTAPAAAGSMPTGMINGRPATVDSGADAAAADERPKPDANAPAPAGWHGGPPDPRRAAAWEGARRAARFASLPVAEAARGAAHIVSYPVRCRLLSVLQSKNVVACVHVQVDVETL